MRHYIGISPSGPTVLRNLRKDETGEPLLLLDESEATTLRVNLADWLESGETVSSATATGSNCTVSASTTSPNVDITVSAATSTSYGKITIIITSSAGAVVRQIIKVRRPNRYTDEQTYRDYT